MSSTYSRINILYSGWCFAKNTEINISDFTWYFMQDYVCSKTLTICLGEGRFSVIFSLIFHPIFIETG